MPTDTPAAEMGRKGIRFIADSVEEMHFIWREMPQPDVGNDGMIELKDGNAATAQFIFVQSKAGRSYMQNIKPHSFDFYSDANHLVYWKKCPNAVILVVYDPVEKVGYWKHVQAYLRQHPEIVEKTPHKIAFDRNKDRFTPKCADALRTLFGCGQAEQEKKLCDHVIAKHSKLTLYSVTSNRPLSVNLEKVFVTLSARKRAARITGVQIGETIIKIVGKTNKGISTERIFTEKQIEDFLPGINLKLRNSESEWFGIRDALMTTAQAFSPKGADSEIILPLNTALRDEKALVVVGEPGAGKTTLLKYLALAFARDKAKERLELEEKRIPILVALRDFNVFINHAFKCSKLDAIGPNVFPAFLNEHFATVAPHLKLSDDFFPALLESGRAIVLLDGLDEVADSSERARMAQLVSDVINEPQWNSNRFVVTSRQRGYEGEPRARLSPHCADCAIRPFEDKDIEQFTLAWYEAVTFDRLGQTPEAKREAKGSADSLIGAIKREPRVRLLAQTPLLLSVLAMVHQRNVELPRLRARLYEECTDFLLGYWDELRDRESDTHLARMGEMDRDAKRALMEPIALWLHERGEKGAEVERADLEKQIAEHFIKEGSDKKAARKKAQEFLQVIQDRSGLIVERSPGVFAFAHLTFQEYLAARAIRDSEGGIAYTLARLHDPWWREVVLLHGSLLSDTRGGQNNARRNTREFIEAIRGAKSHKEKILHRDLLLTIRCMGDMEDNGVDANLRRPLTEEVIKIWKKNRWDAQREEIIASFANSVNTPQGQQFVGALLLEICSGKPSSRNDAAYALGGLGAAAATATVLERLVALSQDGNADMRRNAALVFRRLGAAAATPAVLERLVALSQDGNKDVRREAVVVFGEMGAAAATPTVLERLVALSQDGDADMRGEAAVFFGRLGAAAATPTALERLVALSQDGNEEVRCKATDSLGQLGVAAATPAVLDRLAALGQVRNSSDRIFVACALKKLSAAGATPAVLDRLMALSQDGNTDARCFAAYALGNLGAAAAIPAVLDRLMALSQDGNADVRGSTASALGELGAAAAIPAVSERLVALSQDSNADVRSCAAYALGEQGVAAATPAVLERLVALSQDSNADVRSYAAPALGKLGAAAATPAVLERLVALSQDGNENVRNSALFALGNLGAAAATSMVLKRLLGLIQDSDNVGWHVGDTLGKLGAAAATPAVLERLVALSQDGNKDVRNSAASALGQMDWTCELADAFKLEDFWKKCLSKREKSYWSSDYESLGNFAYRQLQRLVARQALRRKGSSKVKKAFTKPARGSG